MKILSVDDNHANLYLMQALLRGHGHQVVSVHNGVEALRQLEDAADGNAGPADAGFDLIVSDVLMPEMDGFQLCREVKTDERLKRIPFVIYTATYTSRQDEEFGLSLGASRFVVKPVEPEELIAILEEVYRSRQVTEIPAPETTPVEDYLRVYNQRLIKKLERKVEQLEGASRDLKCLIAERDREIARRQNAEHELSRSEEQMRLVWENSLDGLVLTSADGAIILANPAFAHMCGVPLQQIEGAHFSQCGWSEPDKAFAAYRWRHEQESSYKNFEQHLIRPDGKEVLIEGTSTPFASSGSCFVFGIFRDITARRRAEVERVALEAQLAEAQKMESVGSLAGGLAHDFNNLLTVINGYCDLLRLEIAPGSASFQILAQINNAGKRAADLASQLLAFSRRQKIVDAPLDLNALITESLPMLERLVGESIEIVTRLEPALGLVMGDTGQFLQVVMNLAANARDAMPDGGTVTLTTANVLPDASSQTDSGPLVSLAVSDTGTGIAEDLIPHIFDPFFSTKGNEGTGLGLFTASGIVRRNGGSISARSDPSSGTVFEILLPRVLPDHAREAREPRSQEQADVPAGAGETILVTEDRDEVREMVVAVLRHFGYAVLEAGSGQEAMEVSLCHQGPIDLLLTDILMPEMNGRQLAERLKTFRPSTAVLFMSGNIGIPPAPEECIVKPFTVQTLTARVRQLLDRKSP